MKKTLLFLAFLFATANLFAQSTVYVKSYIKSNGTYVQSHYRTSPNSSLLDNYSTRGNYNPYTDNYGTKNIYSSTNSTSSNNSVRSSLLNSTYSSPSPVYNTTYSTPTYNYRSYSTPAYKPVYVGPRGGTYYINSNGNRTYFR